MHNTLKLLRLGNAILTSVIQNILGGIILFSSLLLFINVVMRYVFLAPIFWAEELARYLMVWLIFLGAGLLAGDEGHISVNAITRFLNPRANLMLSRIVRVVGIIFSVVLTWYGWKHTMSVRSSLQVTAALDIPMWLTYLAIPVGGTIMVVRYLMHMQPHKDPEE